MLRCLPDNLQINVVIIMNQQITHSDHAPPRNRGQRRHCFRRDTPGCLADDLNTAYHRILTLRILQKRFLRHALNVRHGKTCRLQNIQEINSITLHTRPLQLPGSLSCEDSSCSSRCPDGSPDRPFDQEYPAVRLACEPYRKVLGGLEAENEPIHRYHCLARSRRATQIQRAQLRKSANDGKMWLAVLAVCQYVRALRYLRNLPIPAVSIFHNETIPDLTLC